MRLLTAWTGTRLSDFDWTVPGELVELAEICDLDANGDGECGCAVSFVGLATGKATTVAAVAELDLDHAMLAAVVRDAYTARGWTLHDETVAAIADEMAEVGERHPIGALVRRNHDTVIEAR